MRELVDGCGRALRGKAVRYLIGELCTLSLDFFSNIGLTLFEHVLVVWADTKIPLLNMSLPATKTLTFKEGGKVDSPMQRI